MTSTSNGNSMTTKATSNIGKEMDGNGNMDQNHSVENVIVGSGDVHKHEDFSDEKNFSDSKNFTVVSGTIGKISLKNASVSQSVDKSNTSTSGKHEDLTTDEINVVNGANVSTLVSQRSSGTGENVVENLNVKAESATIGSDVFNKAQLDQSYVKSDNVKHDKNTNAVSSISAGGSVMESFVSDDSSKKESNSMNVRHASAESGTVGPIVFEGGVIDESVQNSEKTSSQDSVLSSSNVNQDGASVSQFRRDKKFEDSVDNEKENRMKANFAKIGDYAFTDAHINETQTSSKNISSAESTTNSATVVPNSQNDDNTSSMKDSGFQDTFNKSENNLKSRNISASSGLIGGMMVSNAQVRDTVGNTESVSSNRHSDSSSTQIGGGLTVHNIRGGESSGKASSSLTERQIDAESATIGGNVFKDVHISKSSSSHSSVLKENYVDGIAVSYGGTGVGDGSVSSVSSNKINKNKNYNDNDAGKAKTKSVAFGKIITTNAGVFGLDMEMEKSGDLGISGSSKNKNVGGKTVLGGSADVVDVGTNTDNEDDDDNTDGNNVSKDKDNNKKENPLSGTFVNSAAAAGTASAANMGNGKPCSCDVDETKFWNNSKLYPAFAIGSFLAICVQYVFNALASTGPDGTIFLNKTGDLSDLFELDITPAGWTFSIWGFIYAWQASWAVYSLVNICRKSGNGNEAYRDPPFLPNTLFIGQILTAGFNIAWLLTFDRKEIEASFAMLVLYTVLQYFLLHQVVTRLFQVSPKLITDQGRNNDYWLTQALVCNGIGIQLAWVNIATLLNFNMVLVYSGNEELCIEDGGTVALSILTAFVVVLPVLDMGFLDKYLRYTVTPYIVVVVGLAGSISKNWDEGSRNSIFSAVLISYSSVVMGVKFTLTLYRHFTRPRYRTKCENCDMV